MSALSRIAIDDHRYVKLEPGRHGRALGARDSGQREGDRPRDQPRRAARRRRGPRRHPARPRVGARQRRRAEADAVARPAALLRAGPRRVPAALAARADRRARVRRARTAARDPARRGRRHPGVRRRGRRASRARRRSAACSSTARCTGEVGDEVLRDRRHLAEDGLVVPVVAINKQTGALEGVPDVITRGFVMENGQELLADAVRAARRRRRAGERRGAHRPGADQGKAAGGAAPLPPQTFGPPAVRAARHHGDLTREWIERFAPGQRIRGRRPVRRGAHLDHLARELRAGRPGVVLQHRRCTRPPANFAGRVGAFLAELSFQLFGYASYLDSGDPGRRRLALVLVPQGGRAGHEGDRRGAALRVRQRVPQPRVREPGGLAARRSAPAATSASSSRTSSPTT